MEYLMKHPMLDLEEYVRLVIVRASEHVIAPGGIDELTRQTFEKIEMDNGVYDYTKLDWDDCKDKDFIRELATLGWSAIKCGWVDKGLPTPTISLGVFVHLPREDKRAYLREFFINGECSLNCLFGFWEHQEHSMLEMFPMHKNWGTIYHVTEFQSDDAIVANIDAYIDYDALADCIRANRCNFTSIVYELNSKYFIGGGWRDITVNNSMYAQADKVDSDSSGEDSDVEPIRRMPPKRLFDDSDETDYDEPEEKKAKIVNDLVDALVLNKKLIL